MVLDQWNGAVSLCSTNLSEAYVAYKAGACIRNVYHKKVKNDHEGEEQNIIEKDHSKMAYKT